MRKKIWLRAVPGILLAGAAVLLAQTRAEAKTANTNATIMEGVYIGSVDVGGMNAKEAAAALDAYVDSMMDTAFTLEGKNSSIEMTAQEMGVTVDTESSVQEALTVAQSGNLIRRFEETKDLEQGGYVVDMRLQVDKQATAQRIYENKEELDIPAVDNGLVRENGVFTYVEGQKGIEVNVVESVYAIDAFLGSKWNGTDHVIALVTEEIDPRGTEEEFAHIKDVIGSYSTDFSSSSSGRATNVKNGCSRIDGTILYPGEEFSVYEAVSPFTQENGYELAGSYANGTTVESFGGGICQVSTTLYNAALNAELDITMRYNHSMIVTYVEPSMDAAIAGTYKDLRIKNNYEYPIYMEGYCSNGIIYFNIYGEETRPSDREVTYKSEVLETKKAEVEFKTDASRSYGYYGTEQSAHTGYVAQLWKIVTVGGVEESREVINHSTYQASPKIIAVGTGGATEAQLAAINAAIQTGDESQVKAATQLPAEEETDTGEEEGTQDTPDDGEGTSDGEEPDGSGDEPENTSPENTDTDGGDEAPDSGAEDTGSDGSSDEA